MASSSSTATDNASEGYSYKSNHNVVLSRVPISILGVDSGSVGCRIHANDEGYNIKFFVEDPESKLPDYLRAYINSTFSPTVFSDAVLRVPNLYDFLESKDDLFLTALAWHRANEELKKNRKMIESDKMPGPDEWNWEYRNEIAINTATILASCLAFDNFTSALNAQATTDLNALQCLACTYTDPAQEKVINAFIAAHEVTVEGQQRRSDLVTRFLSPGVEHDTTEAIIADAEGTLLIKFPVEREAREAWEAFSGSSDFPTSHEHLEKVLQAESGASKEED